MLAYSHPRLKQSILRSLFSYLLSPSQIRNQEFTEPRIGHSYMMCFCEMGILVWIQKHSHYFLVTTCYNKLKPKPIRVPSRHSCQRHSFTCLSSFWMSVRVLFKCQCFLTSHKQTLPRGVASFLTCCRPGWISFSHTLKIARMTMTHWPHQHFELLSFLAHPNNA